MRAIVELVMRLPGGLFWAAIALAPIIGTVLIGLGIALLTQKKKKTGLGVVALGVASFGVSVILLGCLFLDLMCTGRSGDWICLIV